MEGLHGGYANVVDFGARPNSFLDDTQAFEAAISTSKSVFVPEGIYHVSETLVLNNQNLVGTGMLASQIVNTSPDKKKPILQLGRTCSVSDLLIKFKNDLITGKEKEGERVGILTHTDLWGLQRGSSIRNIRIDCVGTGVYSGYEPVFSVEFNTIEIIDYSFRGLDFVATRLNGSVFDNLYLISEHFEVDCCLHMKNEFTMGKVVLALTKCHTAVSVSDITAYSIEALTLEKMTLLDDGGAFIKIDNSAGVIHSLSIAYVPVDVYRMKFIEIGGGLYDLHEDWSVNKPNVNKFLEIGILSCEAINDPSHDKFQPRQGYFDCIDKPRFFYRDKDAEGEYYVTVKHYAYFSYQSDLEYYDEMYCEDNGRIEFLQKGLIKTHGTTAERPKNRLCPYHSAYFDTDLGKKLIWDGEGWV